MTLLEPDERDDVDELDERAGGVAFRFALDDVPQPGPWSRHGRCSELGHEIFFPGRGESVRQAIEVCQGCAVLVECRDYAVAAGTRLQGVWGGTTPRQRTRMRDQRRREREEPDAPVPVPDERAVAQRPRGGIKAWLEELTLHPGRWARLHFAGDGSANAYASMLRSGARPKPAGRWSFEGRRDPGGEGSWLYACFEPDDVAGGEPASAPGCNN